MDELILANEKQKVDKELKLSEQAKLEKEEYERIVDKQIKDQENERMRDEERQKMRYEHNDELRKQIKIREELERQKRREYLEEGRKMKQKIERMNNTIKALKEEKLAELKNLNVQEKYIAPLERYKVQHYK